MTKPRYTTVISLNKEDYEKLEALKKKGFKVVEVFRIGLREAGK